MSEETKVLRAMTQAMITTIASVRDVINFYESKDDREEARHYRYMLDELNRHIWRTDHYADTYGKSKKCEPVTILDNTPSTTLDLQSAIARANDEIYDAIKFAMTRVQAALDHPDASNKKHLHILLDQLQILHRQTHHMIGVHGVLGIIQ